MPAMINAFNNKCSCLYCIVSSVGGVKPPVLCGGRRNNSVFSLSAWLIAMKTESPNSRFCIVYVSYNLPYPDEFAACSVFNELLV